MPAIDILNVTKKFGKYTAVNNLSLSISENTIFGLLGSNGAGKTTTINMLTGLLLPDSGSITILGTDASKNIENGETNYKISKLKDLIFGKVAKTGTRSYEVLDENEGVIINLNIRGDAHAVVIYMNSKGIVRVDSSFGMATNRMINGRIILEELHPTRIEEIFQLVSNIEFFYSKN